LNHTFESADKEHLAELMRDFPVENPPSLETASNLLLLRFEKLNVEQFSAALLPLNDTEFAERFHNLPRKMHHYLFRDILSNAGMYRNDRDLKGGCIFFGPSQKFHGASPSRIAEGVQEACSHLRRGVEDPIAAVVIFYQQFALVHPFYDANGRIGRFITRSYLDFHGYYISWTRMHQNQKWIKKLNACHRRPGDERYMRLLVNHWKKFILRKTEIEP
jgi:fido (protein-threonine AMPylation protein)